MNDSVEPRQTARILTLMLVTSLTIMAGASISPTLPGIRDHFSDTPNVELLTRLLLTVPALMIAIAAPFVGWLLDRFGRRRLLLVALTLYALAGSAGYVLPTLVSIVLSRAFLGLAVAGTMTTSTTLVGDYFRGADRARLFGMQGAFAATAGVVLLMLSGVMAEVSWRVPFLLYLMPFVLIPFVLRHMHEPPASARVAVDGDVQLSPRMIAFAGALYLTMFGIQIAFYGIPVQLPFFLQELGVNSPTKTGIALGTMTLSAALVAGSFRFVQPLLSRYMIVTVSLSLLGIGVVIASYATAYVHVVTAMVVAGAGMGLNYPNLMGWLVEGTDPAVRGRVVSGVATAAFLGQFSSPLVAQPFIERGGIAHAYMVSGVAMLFGAAIFAALASVRRAKTAVPPAA